MGGTQSAQETLEESLHYTPEEVEPPGPRTFERDWVKGELIGRGEYGDVYLCTSVRRRGLRAAVKVIPHAELDDTGKKVLETELTMLLKLKHPNIIQLYEIYRTNNQVYIVEELCEGGELFERLAQRRRYTEATARGLVKTMLEALTYAHSQGIVHRDINPDNILFKHKDKDNDSNFKIGDWGLASQIVDSGNGEAETIMGNPAYMAPEVLNYLISDSNGRYDEKADVWSVGVLCYTLLGGYNPFFDDCLPVMVANIRNNDLKFPCEYFGEISEEAKGLIRQMLQKDPHKRISAQAALEHAWFAKDSAILAKVELREAPERLKNLLARRRFKKAATAVMTANRLHHIVSEQSR